MSNEDSQSESSNSSPNVYMLRSEKDLTNPTNGYCDQVNGCDQQLLIGGGQPFACKHTRSATVRRASSVSFRNRQDSFAKSQEDLTAPPANIPTERYRRSLDSTYRQSLESISEYKAKKTFSSTTSLGPYRDAAVESTCSDCTDYATTRTKDNNMSSMSYVSWLQTVSSGIMKTATSASTPSNKQMNSASSTNATTSDFVDVDSKVGEWNNFWLNYTNTTSSNNNVNKYTSSPYRASSTTNEDRTGDDVSECKSTSSTQREFIEKMTAEQQQVILTLDEVQEAMHCSQRVMDIMQKALRRSDVENFEVYIERSRQDSYYSQQTNSFNDESFRERSYSYMSDQQELQKQINLLKSPPPPQAPQSATSSCINALLNTGVADILKRVINKRRESNNTDESGHTTGGRSSFSEWSTGAK